MRPASRSTQFHTPASYVGMPGSESRLLVALTSALTLASSRAQQAAPARAPMPATACLLLPC
eukprot:1098107-Pleurochrysis_carterae.AAC.2